MKTTVKCSLNVLFGELLHIPMFNQKTKRQAHYESHESVVMFIYFYINTTSINALLRNLTSSTLCEV